MPGPRRGAAISFDLLPFLLGQIEGPRVGNQLMQLIAAEEDDFLGHRIEDQL